MKILLFFLTILIVTPTFAEGRSPDQIYKTYCGTCHMSGVAGAPISHNEEVWKARNKTLEQLVESSKKGLNIMPAMGLCTDCTDEELKAVIDYMQKKKVE